MTKRDAIVLKNAMAGLRPQIVKNLGPKYDSFAVEYSEVYANPAGELVEHRRRELSVATH